MSARRCSYCSSPAIYLRRYSGEYLCRRHFMESVEARVRRALRGKLRGRLRVGLAVSGGKDSLTMAYIMWRLSRRHPETELVGLIVDEGIRGYRDRSIEHARRLLEQLGISYEIGSFEEEFGVTVDELVRELSVRIPCSYCGVLRRRMLEMLGRRLGVKAILTGHNANDLAETVLLNVIQGNIRHLVQELEVGEGYIPHVTPLRYVPEAEVVLYAYLAGIDYFEDSCPYVPYALRREIRDFLNTLENRHPGIVFNVLSAAERMRRERIPTRPCKICGYPTTRETCRSCEMLEEIRRLKRERKRKLTGQRHPVIPGG